MQQMSKLCQHSQLNHILNYIMKHCPPESNIQMCEKSTTGVLLNSETCLNVTANSEIRQITGVCVDNESLLILAV